MTATPPKSTSDDSYTMLSVGDVESVGAHCQMAYCHQLDFLPFRCDSCHSTFCLDHRSENAHNCPKAGEWARNRRRASLSRSSTPNGTSATLTSKPTLSTATQCYSTTCKTFINTPQSVAIRCPSCQRQYCLKHRMAESHDCKNVPLLGAKPTGAAQSNKDKIRAGFASLTKIKSWGRTQQQDLEKRMSELKPKPKPSSAAARTAELNKLKRDAKGDDKIPVEKRVYLHVEAEKETTRAKMPQMALWFSSEWSVGKVLDEAARRLQVVNENNRVETEEGRLRVYHVEGGRVLEFGEKLGKGVQSGNTVVLLRGVGPGAPSVRT